MDAPYVIMFSVFYFYRRLSELWKVSIVWNDCAMECVMTGKEIEEGHFIWQMVPCVTFHTKLCICIFPISCKLESCKWIIALFGIKVKLTRDYNATYFWESGIGGSFFFAFNERRSCSLITIVYRKDLAWPQNRLISQFSNRRSERDISDHNSKC